MKKSKILVMLLAVAMLAGLLAVPALAAEDELFPVELTIGFRGIYFPGIDPDMQLCTDSVTVTGPGSYTLEVDIRDNLGFMMGNTSPGAFSTMSLRSVTSTEGMEGYFGYDIYFTEIIADGEYVTIIPGKEGTEENPVTLYAGFSKSIDVNLYNAWHSAGQLFDLEELGVVFSTISVEFTIVPGTAPAPAPEIPAAPESPAPAPAPEAPAPTPAPEPVPEPEPTPEPAPELPAPTYPVTAKPATWTGEGEAAWTIDAPAADFTGLLLDGKEVDPVNYTVEEGSTIITFKEDYIKTLKNGKYSFTAQFAGGATAVLELTVATVIPDTAAGGNTALWITITGISALGIAGISMLISRGRRQKI